jgi:hypothetical protein
LDLIKNCGWRVVGSDDFHGDESIIFPKVLVPRNFSIEEATEDFVSEVFTQFANFFPKSFPWSGLWDDEELSMGGSG